LGVGLEEADVLLHDVAVGEEDRGGRDRADVAAGNAAGEDVVGAASTRIQITPDAEVEGGRAEGRTNTAVDVDFSRGAVREGNAFRRGADVELQVLVDVVARLEIGGNRRLMVRLRDT